MGKFEKQFIEQTGVELIVGKDGMGLETSTGCLENKAVHAVFLEGCAVLAATQVEESIAPNGRICACPRRCG